MFLSEAYIQRFKQLAGVKEITRTSSLWKDKELGDQTFHSNHLHIPKSYKSTIEIDDLTLFYDDKMFIPGNICTFLISKNEQLIGFVNLEKFKKGNRIKGVNLISSERRKGIIYKVWSYFISKAPLYSDELQTPEARELWTKLSRDFNVYAYDARKGEYYDTEINVDQPYPEMKYVDSNKKLYSGDDRDVRTNDMLVATTEKLNESYWTRDELSFLIEQDLYGNMKNRVKFNIDMMKQAIEQGREVGLVFQTNNDKYSSPIWKARIIQPVAMGYNSKGNLVVRAIHVTGQSEKEAQMKGVRSAEASNQWRLFKANNIKSMFFTGRFFNKLSLSGYNPRDSAMTNILATFDVTKAKEYQEGNKMPPAQGTPAPEVPKETQPNKPERLVTTPEDKLNSAGTKSKLPTLPTLPSLKKAA